MFRNVEVCSRVAEIRLELAKAEAELSGVQVMSFGIKCLCAVAIKKSSDPALFYGLIRL